MADRIEVKCTISILVATHHIASVDAESKSFKKLKQNHVPAIG